MHTIKSEGQTGGYRFVLCVCGATFLHANQTRALAMFEQHASPFPRAVIRC